MEEKKQLSGQRNGSKVIGVGVGTAYHSAGSSGCDGLVRITRDGKLHSHTGVGNLGTYSHSATSRVAAEVLGYDWANCVIERGDSCKHLPWNLCQFGSNTSFTMTRTNYVAAMDARKSCCRSQLLRLSFHRHEPHARPLHRLATGLGILGLRPRAEPSLEPEDPRRACWS